MDLSGLMMQLSLTQFQLYALSFILGSFAVATWSDLKHMSAQQEFLEIWFMIALVLLTYDAYSVTTGASYLPIAIKWGIIFFFAFISHRKIGIYFHLATGDVIACIAAAAILPAGLAFVFFFILKPADMLLKPVLKIAGKKRAYPFMPVVLVSVLAVIGFAIWVGKM